ncbi:MAG: MFS transporter [Polyangiales bacterium]
MQERPSLDVQKLLDEQPVTSFQARILLLCFAVVLLDGFDTGAIGFIAPSLLKEWGVTRPALAPVLSAALVGLALGALISGPLADRLGRRLVLLGSVALFGVATLGSAYAADLSQLALLRFFTGVGLGAAMPNAVTLSSEYCPTRRRSTLTNAMFCGFPLGAAAGGFLANYIIPQWGWRGVLVIGGVAPIVLAVIAIFVLPDSVRYMIAKQQPVERIRAVLRHLSPAAAQAESFTLSEAAASGQDKGSAIGLVLSKRYWLGSLMLWITYFSGLVIFYALINWMPLLLRDAGLAPQQATLISALFPLGGFGAVFAGWLMDRSSPDRVVSACYGLTGLGMFAIGQLTGQLSLLVIAVFFSGIFMNTAQSSVPSVAAAFYPTHARATGVAWMMGFGRFGGILGSFLVADLTRRQLSFAQIFTIIAIPGATAALAMLVKHAFRPEQAAGETASSTAVESLGH